MTDYGDQIGRFVLVAVSAAVGVILLVGMFIGWVLFA
jgi:hypothetical protein